MQLIEFSLMETYLGEGERMTRVHPANIVNIIPNNDDDDGKTTRVNLTNGEYIIVNGTYDEISEIVNAALNA